MERLDDLQHNGLMLFQDSDAPRFSADALLLCGFLRLAPKDEVVELGSGTGVICVLGADNTGARFTGVEREPELVALSQKSAAYNKQDIRFVRADVAEAPQLLGRGAYTAVVMNPPYFTSGDVSSTPARGAARHAQGDTLGLFLDAAFQLLKNGGKLFLVYPADDLAQLVLALRQRRLEPKRLRFVYAKEDGDALRVLVEAKKLGGPGLKVLPPVFIGEQ